MADGCGRTWRTSRRALTRRSGGRGGKDVDSRADGGGWGRKGRRQSGGQANGRTGSTTCGHADERKRRGRADKRSGGRGDWAVGASIARTAGRMGGLGGWGWKRRGRAN